MVHLIADAGFENYNTRSTSPRKMVEEKKDVVQRSSMRQPRGGRPHEGRLKAMQPPMRLIKKTIPT